MPLSRLIVETLGCLGFALFEFASEVQALGILPHDHQVDRCAGKEGANPAEEFAGPDAGIKVQRLPEVNVDASESGANRGGDRGLERNSCAAARFDHAVGDRRHELRHHLEPGFLLVPPDRDTVASMHILAASASSGPTPSPRISVTSCVINSASPCGCLLPGHIGTAEPEIQAEPDRCEHRWVWYPGRMSFARLTGRVGPRQAARKALSHTDFLRGWCRDR